MKLFLIIFAATLFVGCQTTSLLSRVKVSDYFADPQVAELVTAASRGKVNRVKELVSAGIDVNARGKDGMTPLIYVLVTPRNESGVQALLDNGADPNLFDDDNDSAIHLMTARAKDSSLLRILLENGGDPNLLELPRGRTPIFEAVFWGNTKAIEVLLEFGADINHQDRRWSTPLNSAIEFRVAWFLLQKGADPTLENRNGYTINANVQNRMAFGRADENYRLKVEQWLQENEFWREEVTRHGPSVSRPLREFE